MLQPHAVQPSLDRADAQRGIAGDLDLDDLGVQWLRADPDGIHLRAAEDLRRNPGQWAAYNAARHCVVLAGPGSGKTKTLTIKMARVLAEDVEEPRGVAVVHPDVSDTELKRMADAGAVVVERVVQRRDAPDPPTYVGKGKAEELREVAEEDWVRASPQMATKSQYFMGAEQDALDRQLSMIGEWDWAFGGKALAARAAQARHGLEALGRFDTATLTPRQRTSAAVIRWTLEDTVTLSAFPAHRYVFDQFNGFQIDLINALTQSHPIRRARAARDLTVPSAMFSRTAASRTE